MYWHKVALDALEPAAADPHVISITPKNGVGFARRGEGLPLVVATECQHCGEVSVHDFDEQDIPNAG